MVGTGEDTRAALERTQRRTFAHESHRSAPLTTKAAEWDRRWLEGSSGLQVPKGMQHPTPYENMANQLAQRRSSSSAGTPYQYARESLSPLKSWTDGARHYAMDQPQGSTREQLAHTAYLLGDPENISAVQPGRLRLTLAGVNGVPVMAPISPTRLSSGAIGGTVGQEALHRTMTSRTKPSPAKALISKTDLTKSTHGHLGFERQGQGHLEDRRRQTQTWTRKDHPFEPDSNKVWGGKAVSSEARPWPYNERVRGGPSPDPAPMDLMKKVDPGDSSAKPASTFNQLYGAHVDQSPHDTRRGRPTTPHNIAQHSTAFFGPVNWRSQKAENWEKRLTLSPVKQRTARASGDRLDLGPAASGLGYGRFSISSPDLNCRQ